MEMMGECPRKGKVWLTTHGGQHLRLGTTCKTWGCGPCAKKLLALFRARVEIGVSRLQHCAFISVTYKAESHRGDTAESVSRDWQALWRRFRNQGLYQDLEWLKVPELTKQGIVHWHVVAGPLLGPLRCYGRDNFDIRRFRERMDSCPCVSHVWSRNWLRVTGDSYICHVVPVVGAEGAGRYLAKYLTKMSSVRDALERMGIKRRWSTSRGWPGGGRIRLRATVEKQWRSVQFAFGGGDYYGMEDHNPDGLMERVGEDLTMSLALGRRFRQFTNLAGRLLDVENIRA